MARSLRITILSLVLVVSVFCGAAYAPWIWTPETKKFTNPKNAVKDTPKEQFEWAMTLYNTKDYQRAAFEFEKLAKQYEFSDYASKAQYYVGLCYENMQKYYMAYENYQKAIDNFPHLSNTDEVLAREYAIGLLYLEKPSPKVMGTDIMAPLDRAVEIFKKVVENAPYGKFAEDAQFKLGEALKKSERYEEAIQAYHKITEDYPKSRYATQAMYEESYCAYRASLKPAYDSAATDNAIKTFEKFSDKNKDADLAKKADNTMKRLKDNVAQKSFDVAKFYESQVKPQAAIIYYQDVIDSYPDSSFAKESRSRIEALKTKPVTKPAAGSPLNFDKKKSKEQTDRSQKKLSWNLFGLGTKEQKPSQAPAEAAPKKPGWRPFSFETKKETKKTPPEQPKTQPQVQAPQPEVLQQPSPSEIQVQAPSIEAQPEQPKTETQPAQQEAPKTEAQPEETAQPIPQVQTVQEVQPVEQQTVTQETTTTTTPPQTPEAAAVKGSAQKKSWLSFDLWGKKDKKPAEKQPARKKPWKPFSFEDKKEGPAQPVEKKPWKPFSFEDKKEGAVVPAGKKPSEKKPWISLDLWGKKDDKSEPAEKKPWKPFNFEEKKADKSQDSVNKGWRPLYFGTNDDMMKGLDTKR
jgi:outer membrane protein assembly factor BamD